MRTGLVFKTVEFSLTNFCPLKCKGCPSLSPQSDRKSELKTEGLIQKLIHFEIEKFVLCGNSGEPLEHSSLKSFLFELALQFPTSHIEVCTNGEKILEKFSSEDLEALPKSISFQVALDGPKQSVHELTRVGGDFKKVVTVLEELKQRNVSFDVVFTRHKGNELAAIETAQFIKDHFNKELLFRDTTIVTESLHPPVLLSKKGNVSVLYKSEKRIPDIEIRPHGSYLYIHTTGECYPCVSFVKESTQHKAPNIHDDVSWAQFTKSFFQFRTQFCETYRKTGDIRQCELNCGVYHTFQYDLASDLSVQGEMR